MAGAHRDPARLTVTRGLQERYPPCSDQPTGAAAVIRTGQAELVPEITDEMLEHYAVVGPWDEIGDKLLARYQGTAARVVLYLAAEGFQQDPKLLARWGEVARAIA